MTFKYERRDHDYCHLPDYDNHAIHCLIDKSGALISATCVHREGPGAKTHSGGSATSGGGIRKNPGYNSLTEAEIVTDGLRLSKGMTKKSVALGESVGGAKTVIRWSHDRKELWKAFANEVLPKTPGYIMAKDSGTSAEDMSCIKSFAPSALIAGCTHDTDPSPTTAEGVMLGIQVLLQSLPFYEKGLSSSFAIKGVGAVGGSLVEKLLKTGVFDIRIADPDKKRLDEVCRGRREIKIVDLETIHRQEVDVFIPCALGGSLNKEAIGGLVCSGVAGCENNQLAKPEDGESLHRLGIRYAPDFVINGGGLIKVFTEIIKDRCEKIMLPRIGKNLHEIFIRSEEEDRATSIIAEEIVKGRVEQAMSIPR